MATNFYRAGGERLGFVRHYLHIGDRQVAGRVVDPEHPGGVSPSVPQSWMVSGPNDPPHVLQLEDGTWIEFHIVKSDRQIVNGRRTAPPAWADGKQL